MGMRHDDEILAALKRAKGGLLSAKQLAEAAQVPPGERKALQHRLREWVREGKIEQEGRRFRLGTYPLEEVAPAAPRERRADAEPKATKRPAAQVAPAAPRGERRADAEPRATKRPAAGPPQKEARWEALLRQKEQALEERLERARPEERPAAGEPEERKRKLRPEARPPADEQDQRKRKTRPPYGSKASEIVGTLTLRPEGYGFVRRLEGPMGEDVFLPPHELVGALDGDKVRVRIVRGKFGRDAGVLLEIVSHRRRNFLGIYQAGGKRTAVVTPVDPSLPRTVPVQPLASAKTGQVVKVGITAYPTDAGGLRGEVEKVVGEPGDPIVEVLEVAYANGFAEDFPPEVREEARSLPNRVLVRERAGRRDLTSLPLVTIDGEDARDFDDAVFVERMPRGGYRLVVAIADVSHYVRQGSKLDEEALARATSVYFPNHVLPMLPERLSNGICSLNPGEERLCMVCDLALDSSGMPVEAQLYEGVMRSHARCTYEQVEATLEGQTPEELLPFEEELRLAGELAAKLRKQRALRGALDFDLPESRAVLNKEMLPIAIERRARTDAHRLIEEFMIAANEAVARHFSDRELPTVYRVHDEPDPEKLERFAALARAVGFVIDVEEGVTPAQLSELLREIEGSPQERALNTLLLRSLMQAIYQPENIGHYGLASENYLHFTSPIRRYPDLIVHRLLKEHWARAGRSPRGKAKAALEEELDVQAAHASERERAAADAERDIDQYFKCLFLQDRVGESFQATIVSITDFGFFAELDDVPAEGLVPADELGSRWELDEQRYRLVFPGSGRSFGIGDQVVVELAGVDLEKRQIHLTLLQDQEGKKVSPKEKERGAPLASAVEVVRGRRMPGRKPTKTGGSRGEKKAASGRGDKQAASGRGDKQGASGSGGKRAGAQRKSTPRTRKSTGRSSGPKGRRR